MNAEWLELGKKPVRADAPSGDPIRDSTEFEALQLEMRKLEQAEGVPPDWRRVADDSAALLAKSKDLLVASWLTMALLQREGYPGLEAGLSIVRDLCDGHWDALYPEAKRMKGRVAAVEWLLERATKEVMRRGAQPGESEKILAALERLKEIDALLEAKVPGGGPSIGEFRTALEEVDRRAAPASPAPAAAAAVGAAGGAAPALASATDVPQALTHARSLLRQIADILRTAEPQNALCYRLPRVAAWVHLTELPPHTDGQTQIPPPPPDFVTKIEQMAGQGQWAGVLEQSEARFSSTVFWLDLQRYSAQALDALGHANAVKAVVEEVGVLVRRFPEITTLKFKDGRALADATTLAWIRDKVMAAGDGAGGGGAAPAAAAAAAVQDEELAELPVVRAQAMQLARQRKLPDALRLLEERRATARTARARSAWRLEQARILADRNQDEAALALLKSLDEEMSATRADDWEPALAADVLKSLLLTHRKVLSSIRPIPPEEQQRSREWLGRLVRLDPGAAASAMPTGS